jgi:phosphomevalonate kinase
MKKIILISAKAQHGKDTFANMLKDRLEAKGNKIVIDHFAKYIKNLMKEYYHWDGTTKNEEIREKLQWLGTERIKEDLNYKCFHAKRLAEDFQIVQDDFDYFLIPDTRFKDEIFIMKAMFPNQVITVRIQRDNFTGGLTEEQLKHKSEIDLDDFRFDLKIQNNGTLEDLKEKVEAIIQYYNL